MQIKVKKIAVLFVLFLYCFPSMADDIEDSIETYRIPCYNTAEEYMSLVGKTITYVPIKNKRNINMINKFGSSAQYYIITNISKRWQKKRIGRCDWKLKNIETGGIESITVYYGNRLELLDKTDIDIWDLGDEVRIFDMPFLMGKLDYKQRLYGLEYVHPLVKAKYKKNQNE